MSHALLVNDRCLLSRGSGIPLYCRNVMSHWPAASGAALVGFCSHRWRRAKLLDESTESVTQQVTIPLRPLTALQPRAPHRRTLLDFARRLLGAAYGHALRRETRAARYAAMWEPNYLVLPTRLPTVTSMLDLSVLEHPDWHPAARVAHWERALPVTLSQSAHYITSARFTAERMQALLGIPPARISVIPLAARPLPYPAAEPGAIPGVGAGPGAVSMARQAAGLPASYFLHLGTIEPRKNLSLLLDAFAQCPPAMRKRCPLILAGSPGWGAPSFFEHLSRHPMAPEVRFTGYVSDAAAAVLLAGARAVLVPSHYEGFGLPLVEAMACGTPVLCSDIPTFTEVVGQAAAMLPVSDPTPWAVGMVRLLEDEPWRQQLARAGPPHAGQFNWSVTAQHHARVIESVMR